MFRRLKVIVYLLSLMAPEAKKRHKYLVFLGNNWLLANTNPETLRNVLQTISPSVTLFPIQKYSWWLCSEVGHGRWPLTTSAVFFLWDNIHSVLKASYCWVLDMLSVVFMKGYTKKRTIRWFTTRLLLQIWYLLWFVSPIWASAVKLCFLSGIFVNI